MYIIQVAFLNWHSMDSAVTNKHQQRTEATRAKLMKAARRIFARDGFEAARIEDIAAEAGHTRGAFYANFATKADLFFALLEQQTAEHVARILELMECCPTPDERLAALREYYVHRLSDRQWSILMLEFKLFALRHGRLRPKLVNTHRKIRALLKSSVIEKLLSPDLPGFAHQEAIRRALEATLYGLVVEHAYDPAAISEEQVEAFLRQIFDLLTGCASAGPGRS